MDGGGGGGGCGERPTYESVCALANTYTEALRITFDLAALSFEDLLERHYLTYASVAVFKQYPPTDASPAQTRSASLPAPSTSQGLRSIRSPK